MEIESNTHSKAIVIFKTIAWSICIATCAYTVWQLNKISLSACDRVASINAQLRVLKEETDGIKKGVDASQCAIENKVWKLNEISNDICDRVATITEQLRALKKETEEIKKGVDASQRVIEDKEDTLARMKALLDASAQENILKAKEEDAQKAFELAKEAVEKNMIDDAMVYCINAIGKVPYKSEYYSLLNELAELVPDVSGNARKLSQVANIMEIGVYQVSSNYMETVALQASKLRDRLAAIEDLELTPSEKDTPSVEEIMHQQQDLATAMRNASAADQKAKAEEYAEFLSDYGVMIENEVLLREEMKAASNMVAFYGVFKSFSQSVCQLEKALSEPKNLTSEQLPAISAGLQTASMLYSQAVSLASEVQPNAEKELQNCSNCLVKCMNQYQIAKSQPYLRSANKLLNDESANPEDKAAMLADGFDFDAEQNIPDFIPNLAEGAVWSRIINNSTKKQRLVGMLLGRADVSCPEMVELKKKMTELAHKIEHYQAYRMEAYQKWAIGRCEEAWKFHKDTTPFNDEDAESLFKDYLLSIDTSLLTPQVLELYHSLLTLCRDELPKKKMTDLEVLSAKEKKKTLNAF